MLQYFVAADGQHGQVHCDGMVFLHLTVFYVTSNLAATGSTQNVNFLYGTSLISG